MQPPSSDTPLIGIYFSCIMVIVAVSVVTTIMVLNFHHRAAAANCEMPTWIRTVFLQWLPWLLRMESPGGEEITARSIMMENKVRFRFQIDAAAEGIVIVWRGFPFPAINSSAEQYDSQWRTQM